MRNLQQTGRDEIADLLKCLDCRPALRCIAANEEFEDRSLPAVLGHVLDLRYLRRSTPTRPRSHDIARGGNERGPDPNERPGWTGPERKARMIASAGVALIALLFLAYWIPTVLALARDHHQKGAIIVINALLGWTFVGWVVALAMACSAVRAKTAGQ